MTRHKQHESSGAASPKEQTMNSATMLCDCWTDLVADQNNKGLEALIEIIFLCCLVDTGKSGWLGTIVI